MLLYRYSGHRRRPAATSAAVNSRNSVAAGVRSDLRSEFGPSSRLSATRRAALCWRARQQSASCKSAAFDTVRPRARPFATRIFSMQGIAHPAIVAALSALPTITGLPLMTGDVESCSAAYDAGRGAIRGGPKPTPKRQNLHSAAPNPGSSLHFRPYPSCPTCGGACRPQTRTATLIIHLAIALDHQGSGERRSESTHISGRRARVKSLVFTSDTRRRSTSGTRRGTTAIRWHRLGIRRGT